MLYEIVFPGLQTDWLKADWNQYPVASAVTVTAPNPEPQLYVAGEAKFPFSSLTVFVTLRSGSSMVRVAANA